MRMIEDMKKTIKKKKAFTLVELMGVLVIIGVLSAILIPVISKTLKENKQKVYERQLDSIKLAAKNLGSDNVFILPVENDNEISVTLRQLKNMGYMQSSIINPLNNTEFSDCTVIKIKKVENIYEYTIDINSINLNNCDVKSKVLISDPSKKFIKENSSSSYIITVGNDNNNFGKYNIDTTKVELTGAAAETAKYSIVGENGIYKLLLIGGVNEGDLSFQLNDGLITDESGNKVDTSSLTPNTIYVDNFAPTITFTNNGSDWTNEAKTKIEVADQSDGDSTTYKYIYSMNRNDEPINKFNSDEEVTNNIGNGDYYLVASACDNAGNCTKNVSNVFKMDTVAPIIESATVRYNNTTHGGEQSRVMLVINEELSGVSDVKGENYAIPDVSDGESPSYVTFPKSWNAPDVDNAGSWWHNFGYVSNGNRVLYIRNIIVTDKAGNVGVTTSFDCPYTGIYQTTTVNNCTKK